jgi:hypothetical protein
MTKRADERPIRSDSRDDEPEERVNARAESDEVAEVSPGESEGGEPPGIDEIRLEAYYRYLQREDGNEDEIADWLAAESDLRARAAPDRADQRRGTQG